MADGTQHRVSILGTAIGTIAGGLSVNGLAGVDHLPWLVVGELAGIILHPDLDQIEARRGFSFAKLIFYPYGVMVKHRSAISHWPILGTTIRLVYLAAIIIPLILFLSNTNLNSVISVIQSHQFINFAIGLAISDTVHFAIDFSGIYRGTTWRKQSQARKRRRTAKRRTRYGR